MSDLLILFGKSGFILFTVGLLIGLAIPRLRNPRMALSAHLTAVQIGPALIAFALFWQHLNVPALWAPFLIYGLIVSSYVLTGGILMAASSGASEALPIAGRGFNATKTQELMVSLLVRLSSVGMAGSCLAVCFFFLTGR